jgi:hypothetical protein
LPDFPAVRPGHSAPLAPSRDVRLESDFSSFSGVRAMCDLLSFLLLGDAGGATLVAVMITAIVVGSGMLVYFGLMAPSDAARALALENERFAQSGPNSGPVRRYPATGEGYLPAAVAALGEPEHLHRYESIAEQCHLGWLCGSAADKHPTYISYDSALVVVTPDAYTVIPWEEITEFLHTVGFKASSGQKFVIGPDFTNYGPLYERLQNEILASQLPRALAAVEAGQEWLFEPFTAPTTGSWALSALGQPHLTAPLAIGKQGIRYKEKSLAWSDVGSIQVTRHLMNGALCRTTLSVRKNWGLFSALEFDFKSVANSFLLTELLPHVCPAHLLVPAGSGNN